MSDLISRSELIKVLKDRATNEAIMGYMTACDVTNSIIDEVEEQPTAYDIDKIAEWLEELKDYRDKNKMVVRFDCENMDSIKDKIVELSKYAEIQYNKALDDFVMFANTMPTVEEEDGEIRPMRLEEMAERLKVGETE